MSTLVVGLSHGTAPVELLERVALAPAAVAGLLDDVAMSDHVSEALVLSTCNRVEVYAEVDTFHGGLGHVSELLAQHTGVDLDELSPYLTVHFEEGAAGHLFSVACGLDSMVVGESQVLGQVRVALRAAQDAGCIGRQLGALAQQALRVGKRARRETGIDRAGRSLVNAGLDSAARTLGSLKGLSVLVVGAGAMSTLAASVVAQSGAAKVLVANRTLERGERLAEAVGGEALSLANLPIILPEVDLLVSCTGTGGHVLDVELLAGVAGRPGRPFVVLDLAMPRDVDPAARDLDGVTVVDLETLAGTLVTREPEADVEKTRRIVAEEVAAFLGWRRAARVAPTVVALRTMADAIVQAELMRLAGRVPGLDARSRAEVEQTVSRVVDKLLHSPTVRVKQLAEEPGGPTYADALVRLFDLDPDGVRGADRPSALLPAALAGGPIATSGRRRQQLRDPGPRERSRSRRPSPLAG